MNTVIERDVLTVTRAWLLRMLRTAGIGVRTLANKLRGKTNHRLDSVVRGLNLEERARNDALRYGPVDGIPATETQREITYYCREKLNQARKRLSAAGTRVDKRANAYTARVGRQDLDRVVESYALELERLAGDQSRELSLLRERVGMLQSEHALLVKSHDSSSGLGTIFSFLFILASMFIVAVFFVEHLAVNEIARGEMFAVSGVIVGLPAVAVMLGSRVWERLPSLKWGASSLLLCVVVGLIWATVYVIQGTVSGYVSSLLSLWSNIISPRVGLTEPWAPGAVFALASLSTLASLLIWDPSPIPSVKHRLEKAQSKLRDELLRRNETALKLLEKTTKDLDALHKRKSQAGNRLMTALRWEKRMRSAAESRAIALNALCNQLQHRYLALFSQFNWNGEAPEFAEKELVILEWSEDQQPTESLASVEISLEKFGDDVRAAREASYESYRAFVEESGLAGAPK